MKKTLSAVPPALPAAELAEKKLRKKILLSNLAAVVTLSLAITFLAAAAFGALLDEIAPDISDVFFPGFALWLAVFLALLIDATQFERRRSLGWKVSLPGLLVVVSSGIIAYFSLLDEPIRANLHVISRLKHIDFIFYGIGGLICIGTIAIILWNRKAQTNVIINKNSWVVGYSEPPVQENF